jgi:hypothetical protein
MEIDHTWVVYNSTHIYKTIVVIKYLWIYITHLLLCPGHSKLEYFNNKGKI